jgi:outer membrane lipoprotein-sorting protein
MKRFLFFGLCISVSLVFCSGVWSQTAATSQAIVTADAYLAAISDRYAGINDYQARIAIQSGSSTMEGSVIYLKPYYMRIDFTRPANQVIVYDGSLLRIYIPDLRAVLTQSASTSSASLASAQGLSLLRRNYSVSFETGPDPVPLEGAEMAVRLRLLPRPGVSEGWTLLTLSINPDTRLIRRIEGTTIAGVQVRFDFSNIELNVGIPRARFEYDSPASANLYNNFLFSDTE